MSMDVVSINGVEYTKAAKLAKQFKYTADYIGQLCRGRKVDAKLVGRTWYVSEASLVDHKNGRHAALRSDEKIIFSKPEVAKVRTEVERPLDKKTLRSLPPLNKVTHFARHIEWKPVRYEADDSDLLPAIKPAVRIQVGIADAVPVTVMSQERPVTLVADSLPEVSLRGTLKIGSLDDDFEISDENIAEVDSREVIVSKAASPAKRSEKAFTYGVKIREVSGLDQVALVKEPAPTYRFTPTRVRKASEPRAANIFPDEKSVTGSNPTVRLLCLLLVVFLLLSTTIIFVDFTIEATASEFNSGVSLTPLSTLNF
jgi:hypothetical protein